MEESFRDGCDDIRQALAAKGVELADDSPDAIIDAINNINPKPLIFTSSPVNMSLYTDRWRELTIDDFVFGG